MAQYLRTFTTPCPSRLLDAINADTGITPTCLQIINYGLDEDWIFEFDSNLGTTGNPSEEAIFDALLAAWTCPPETQDPVNTGSASVFGSEFDQDEDETTSSTTSPTYQTKLTLNSSSLPSGTYRIGWYCEVMGTSSSGRTQVSVATNGTTLANPQVEHEDKNDWIPFTGFRYQSLSGSPSTTISWRRQGPNHMSSIRRARIEIWRVS